MRYSIEKIPADEWTRDFSESMHSLVFGKHKPASWDRIDFALLFIDAEKNTPFGFATLREIDEKAVYMQFGGSIPAYRGHFDNLRAYVSAIDWLKREYKFISTKIENTNKSMLRFAEKAGFLIVGATTVKGAVMLEHLIEVQS